MKTALISCDSVQRIFRISHLYSFFYKRWNQQTLVNDRRNSIAYGPRINWLTPDLQSCSGLSFKSQVLYLIVFVTRYLGLSLGAGLVEILVQGCVWRDCVQISSGHSPILFTTLSLRSSSLDLRLTPSTSCSMTTSRLRTQTPIHSRWNTF